MYISQYFKTNSPMLLNQYTKDETKNKLSTSFRMFVFVQDIYMLLYMMNGEKTFQESVLMLVPIISETVLHLVDLGTG